MVGKHGKWFLLLLGVFGSGLEVVNISTNNESLSRGTIDNHKNSDDM